MKLPLTNPERAALRKAKIKVGDVATLTVDQLTDFTGIEQERARELIALATFQQIKSIGIEFAKDLVFLGLYDLESLIGQDPAQLLNDYEFKKGFWTDSCVEDQFRLAVYFAETSDNSRSWFDFTRQRKENRFKNGYPTSRPSLAWHEVEKR